MRQESLTFNPDVDIREVDQFGFVDIHDAVVNGVIPSSLESQEAKYNNVEDPRQMRARPDDVFSGLRAERSYGAFVRHAREQSTAQADENP